MKTPRHAQQVVVPRARPPSLTGQRALTRAEQRALLGWLKDRLVREHLPREESPEVRPRVQWAAEEAAALAWASPFPLLVLPELVKEKVTLARAQADRQARIRRQSAALWSGAV